MLVRQQPDSIKAIGQILCSMAMKILDHYYFHKVTSFSYCRQSSDGEQFFLEISSFFCFYNSSQIFEQFSKIYQIMQVRNTVSLSGNGHSKKSFPSIFGQDFKLFS